MSMNTIAINSNMYKGAEMYAKLHHISVEAVVEKGLSLLLEKFHPKEKTVSNSGFEQAMAIMDTMMAKGGKRIPVDENPMDVFVEQKYGL